MIAANRGRNRIRAPRRGPAEDEQDPEKSWASLRDALTQIHTKNASHLSYEQLYRLAYRLVLQKKGEMLYDRVRDFKKEWLSSTVFPKIEATITTGLADPRSTAGANVNERRVAGERFLKALQDEWQDHQVCNAMMADVLMYLDRVYCTDYRLPSVYDIAMALFRDNLLKSRGRYQTESSSTADVLISVILEQIQMERDGDVINRNAIKRCVYMMETLEVSQNNGASDDRRLYGIFFEPRYLEDSREFYRSEAGRMLNECDSGSYCRQTLKKINEEIERCRSCLSESSERKIESVVEDELISAKLQELVLADSGVQFMVDNDRLDDLSVLYELNIRVEDKLSVLTKAVTQRVIEMGQEINKAVELAAKAPPPAPADGEAEKSKSAEKGKAMAQQTISAIKWVDDVLALKDKYDAIWKQSFQSNKTLQAALTRSFTDFINSSSFNRGSEYISLFIDENMRKGIKNKTEAEIDQILDKAIILLRYVQDKDMFERYYKKHLSRRLLMNKSVSMDSERSMISRMKIELGNSFTNKLEAMFKDMSISEDLSKGYKQHVARMGDVDPSRVELSINVLTAMTWPLETDSGASGDNEGATYSKVIYPPGIQRVRTGFEKFYSDKHSGRKLTWQPHLGTADLKARLWRPDGKGGKTQRTFEYNVSTYAMLILLLFNNLNPGDSLSFEDIQARTNIPTNDLVRNLQSLAVAQYPRVLTKEPMSREVNPDDRFSFNEKFQPRSQKVKIGVVLASNKVESDRERMETAKRNDENRHFCIDAAIVRIMKQRKQLEHSKLIAETISQLAHQFKPEVPMIKQRIENLIEREYLERVEDANPAAYKYLA